MGTASRDRAAARARIGARSFQAWVMAAGCGAELASVDETSQGSTAAVTEASSSNGDTTGRGGETGEATDTTDAGEGESSTTHADTPPAEACAAIPIAAEAAEPIGAHALVDGEMYVVYSELRQTDSNWSETSNIVILRGESDAEGDDVWVFGTGYGDGGPLDDFPPPRPSQYPSRSGDADAADADAVIRNCLGVSASRARLRLLTPHFHFDHMNYDFVGGLLERGYAVDRLTLHVHVLDEDATFCGEACRGTPTGGGSLPAFPSELEARAESLGTPADPCGEVVAEFTTPALGGWSIRLDSGHTDGTISVDNVALGVRLRGAAMGCLPAEPTLIELRPHGPLGASWAGGTGARPSDETTIDEECDAR